VQPDTISRSNSSKSSMFSVAEGAVGLRVIFLQGGHSGFNAIWGYYAQPLFGAIVGN
jgi:hypothetical protein